MLKKQIKDLRRVSLKVHSLAKLRQSHTRKHTHTHTHTHTHIYIYIYIYIKWDREEEIRVVRKKIEGEQL